jgi:hypothetical protein
MYDIGGTIYSPHPLQPRKSQPHFSHSCLVRNPFLKGVVLPHIRRPGDPKLIDPSFPSSVPTLLRLSQLLQLGLILLGIGLLDLLEVLNQVGNIVTLILGTLGATFLLLGSLSGSEVLVGFGELSEASESGPSWLRIPGTSSVRSLS